MIRQLFWTVLTAFATCTTSFAESPAVNWTDRISLSGDFRYRHESIFRENQIDENRHRLRLRVSLVAKINESTDMVARVASGHGEATSTLQTLGDELREKPLWIDRAYAEFRPFHNGKLLAGRFELPNPFTDMTWDPDINVEGGALDWVRGPKQEVLFLSAGGYWVVHEPTRNLGLLNAHAGRKFVFGGTNGKLLIGYSDYQAISGWPGLGGSGRGNSLSGGTYQFDYNLAQVLVLLGHPVAGGNLGLMGEVAQNTAIENANKGWLAGLSFKRRADKTEWEFAYNYRSVDADAALGHLVDSDFAGGRTDASGHKIAATCWAYENTLFRVTYFNNTVSPHSEANKRHYERLMADVEVKF